MPATICTGTDDARYMKIKYRREQESYAAWLAASSAVARKATSERVGCGGTCRGGGIDGFLPFARRPRTTTALGLALGLPARPPNRRIHNQGDDSAMLGIVLTRSLFR